MKDNFYKAFRKTLLNQLIDALIATPNCNIKKETLSDLNRLRFITLTIKDKHDPVFAAVEKCFLLDREKGNCYPINSSDSTKKIQKELASVAPTQIVVSSDAMVKKRICAFFCHLATQKNKLNLWDAINDEIKDIPPKWLNFLSFYGFDFSILHSIATKLSPVLHAYPKETILLNEQILLLSKRCDSLAQENKTLEHQVNDADIETSIDQQRTAFLKEQVAQLHQENDKLVKKNTKLLNSLEDSSNTNEILIAKIKRQENEIKELQWSIEQLLHKLNNSNENLLAHTSDNKARVTEQLQSPVAKMRRTYPMWDRKNEKNSQNFSINTESISKNKSS